MNRILISLLLIAAACTTKSTIEQQGVDVSKEEKEVKVETKKAAPVEVVTSWNQVETSLLEQPGYFPQFTPDGKGMIYSTSNYQGLWHYDFELKKSRVLTEQRGAGYQPQIKDGNIVFQVKSRLKHIESVSLLSGEMIALNQTHQRLTPKEYVDLKSNIKIAIADDLMAINVLNGDNISVLIPQGKKNYLYVSLSPSQDQLMYKAAGLGVFIADLDGNTIMELGDVSEMSWINNNEIVYVKSKDDGMQSLSSQVFVYQLDSQEEMAVSQAIGDLVEHPKTNPHGNQLLVNTPEGSIYLISKK